MFNFLKILNLFGLAAQADLNVENPAVGSAEVTVQLDNMAVDRVGEPAVSSGASLEESEHKVRTTESSTARMPLYWKLF